MAIFADAFTFIIKILCDFYISVLLLRFLLHCSQANFYHPFCQSIAKMTAPIVNPLNKILPYPKRIEVLVLMVAILVEIIKLILLAFITPVTPHFLTLGIVAVGEIINQIFNIYFYAILIYVLLSWLPLPQLLPILELLNSLVSPILQPIRRYAPSLGGIDISPLIAMILLHVGSIIVTSYLI